MAMINEVTLYIPPIIGRAKRSRAPHGSGGAYRRHYREGSSPTRDGCIPCLTWSRKDRRARRAENRARQSDLIDVALAAIAAGRF